jgi:hypothetical protein
MCPGLAAGGVRVCLGWPLGERCSLAFGGSQGFLQLGGQLPELPFQVRHALLEALILGQKFFVTRSGHP